jgi:hypothetical protein
MKYWLMLPMPARASIMAGLKVLGNSVWVFGALLLYDASTTSVTGQPTMRYTDTAPLFFGYVAAHWWPCLVAIAMPLALRVREGWISGQNTAAVALPSGQTVTAVVTAPHAPSTTGAQSLQETPLAMKAAQLIAQA